MKKIAIITFCNNKWQVNYGQVLQCYAMQEICKKIDGQVKVIRYRERCNDDILKCKLPLGILNELYENWCQKRFAKNGYGEISFKFQNFMKRYVNLTYPCYSIKDVENLTKDTDILLCGSDQIWNPFWINDFYTLNFGTSNQRRISYAASGIVPENKYSINKYKVLSSSLNNFDAISLRETLGIEILKKYTNKEIASVLDPTLLLNSEEWDNIASKRLIDEPYIFCYTLRGVKRYKMLLKELKNYYGANKVVFVEAHTPQTRYWGDFTKITNVGPLEFLSLIKYSKAVCTDSFHGVAFSLNYKKQFCTFSVKDADMFYCANRQKDILDKCHISSRNCDSLRDIEKLTNIDYKEVQKHLKKEQENSWNFLNKAINN